MSGWIGRPAEWTDGDTAYLSVVFTWHLREAYSRACWYRAQGYRVVAGGPALFLPKMREQLAGVAEIPTRIVERPDRHGRMQRMEVLGLAPRGEAADFHNPLATSASRGCPVGCWFCIVPKMDGYAFELLPDFTPRPILCDNNLSALPADYQRHIVERYRATGVSLLDANSGFEPKTFDEDVFERWRPINKGPWRFAFDETQERDDVYRVMGMLRQRGVNPRRIQVYVIIGTEPFEACMDRIRSVIAWGGEPYAQPFIKLNALEKTPDVRHDWTPVLLDRVKRWVNWRSWKKVPFERYDPSAKTSREVARELDRLFD